MKKIVIKLMESDDEKISNISEESPFPEKNGLSQGENESMDLPFSDNGPTSNSTNGELKGKDSEIKNDDVSQNSRNEAGESYNPNLDNCNDLTQELSNFLDEIDNNLKNESQGTGCHDLSMNQISDSHKNQKLLGKKTLNPTETFEVGTKNSKKKTIKLDDFIKIMKQANSNTLDNDSEEDKRRYYLEDDVSPFNKDYYKKNNCRYNGPMDREYIKMENILEKYENQLSSLYEDDNGNQGKIFENKDELLEIAKTSEKYEKLSNYIEKDKRYIYRKKEKKGKKKRMPDPDKLTEKIKGNLISSFIDVLNSYEEFKKKKIEKIDKELVNKEGNGDFNLVLLQILLIRILNNSQENKERIKEIIDGDKTVERNSIKTIVNLKFQNCLDIFRYKEDIEGIGDKFNYKLVNFLKEEYKIQTGKKKEMDPKEYIVLLLSAVYNYENILKKRKMNEKKK